VAQVEKIIINANLTTQTDGQERRRRRQDGVEEGGWRGGGGGDLVSAAHSALFNRQNATGQRRQAVAEEESVPKQRKIVMKQDFICIAVRRRQKCQISYGTDDRMSECAGHGSCVDGRCVCDGGWAGPICNNTCVDCTGHGSCSPVDGIYIVYCYCFAS
jgi:hypothetical protein